MLASTSYLKASIAVPLSFSAVLNLWAGDVPWRLISVSGDTLSDCLLLGTNSVFLLIDQQGTQRWMSVESIAVLDRPVSGHFWKGMGIGVLTGAVAGGLIGGTTYKEPDHASSGQYSFDMGTKDQVNGLANDLGKDASMVNGVLIGAAAGAVLGVVVGEVCSHGRESYDLKRRTLNEKRQIIEGLIAGEIQ